MNRAWSVLFCLLAALACTDRPNVIVVMTDDQRWDTVEHMPYLSELAKQGVVFENAFVTSPLCCPSRASFLSGQPMARHEVRTNRPPHGGAPAFDAEGALPVELKKLGYRTGLFGKYMNAVDALDEQPPPGWDVWHAFVNDGFNYLDYLVSEDGEHVVRNEYSTDWMVERAIEFIEDGDGPFFLLYAPYAPHFNGITNVIPAERHAGAFADYVSPERPSFAEADLSNKPPFMGVNPVEIIEFLEPELARYEREALESLLAVDEAVERLIGVLETRGLADTTVLIYTSDNGMLYGEHRLIGKNFPYEESIRVPLVAWCPIACPPRRVPELVTNLDLPETILDLAGFQGSFGVGRSLVPLIAEGGVDRQDEPGKERFRSDRRKRRLRNSFRDSSDPAPDFSNPTIRFDGWPFTNLRFTIFNRSTLVPGWTAWRGKDWKYIIWHDGTQELYDLEADPHELVNLLAPAESLP